MTDFIQQNTYNKLQDLAKELSSIYPCSIQVHIVDNKEFEGCNTFGEHQGYATYYRLLLARFLPKEIEKVLYLDTDMLAQGDIRECFSIDLGENIVGAVCDIAKWNQGRVIVPFKQYSDLESFTIDSTKYYNAGFLLINLKVWRQYDIEKQALHIAKRYDTDLPDQDVLNIITKNKTFFMELKWNVFVAFLLRSGYDYPDKVENAKILHYAASWLKPWMNYIEYNDGKLWNPYNPNPAKCSLYCNLWWEMALQTPVFDKELEILYHIKIHERQLIENINIALSHSYSRLNGLTRRVKRILNPHKFIIDAYKKWFKKTSLY